MRREKEPVKRGGTERPLAFFMEGDPEESDEDLQGSTLLWEKCIQQSIFVDLSEDESLHFSDLEASLALHLSQAESAASEASVHLSGSAELSGLDDTSSESSNVCSQSEKVVENKTKSSILHVSVLRPNAMQDEPPYKRGFEDSGQNTSDEDQDDLPYDHDLGSPYFNQTASSEGNTSSDGRETVHASPDGPGLLEFTTTDRDDIGGRLVSTERNAAKPATSPHKDTSKQDKPFDAYKPSDVAPSCPSPADINQLLLRHFSREELLRPGRLIEAETLPEVSLLESMDDTVLSRAPTHKSTTTDNHSEIPACDSEICKSTNSSLENEAERKIDNVTSAADSIASSRDSTWSSRDNSDVVKRERSEEDDEVQRVPLVYTRSFGDLKYGQGQVHYPLPDFSKVAPKVKIPKAQSGSPRPVPRSPSTMHRAQSSPGMLELISRVLEDSVQQPEKPYVFKDEDKQTPPALVHHLQAEYDKLLTKYAEAENLIDQMRLGTNTQPSAELMLYSECEDDHLRNLAEGNHHRSSAPQRPSTEDFGQKRRTAPESNVREVNTASSGRPAEAPSDGLRMTAELRDIISPFMQKVEEFRVSVGNMSIGTDEQQMMLRSMMEAQDQLERKHMSKKDEHRALEMQNYMGLSRNTGTFDPNRLVEGDIFRIGMHLDTIKEMIDKNVREQISPPHSSSSPTPVTEKLHVKPRPPSPPPSLHEGPCAGFSTVSYKMETQREEETAEEDEEASEVHRDDGLERSRELITTESVLKYTGYNNCHSWSSQGSLERQDIQRAEDEEGAGVERSSVLSEGIVHGNILAYLSGTRSTPRQEEWTPESHSTPNSVRVPEGKCDLADCVSLSVEVSSSSDAHKDPDTSSLSEPPVDTTCASQRIVSLETDSGFGSSYLNRSATGSFQPTLLIESSSVPSHNNGLSSSDSEGSCANLRTTVHPASLDVQRWATSHPSVQTQFCGATAAVERWVESTTKESSVRLQGCDASLPAQLHHCVSQPELSTAMESEDRGSQVYSCTCNSEAILALQSEVSRLKEDLEEGLVQLPHLAQKMDYLTSKYRQGGLERRSKTRPRTQLRPAGNSPARKEDWIYSDMDPSKSKGTDSGTALSEVMSQSHSSPVGSRRGSIVRSEPEFQYKPQGTLQSTRGTERNCSVKTSGLTSSTSKGGRGRASYSPAEQRPRMAIMERFYSKERWSALSSPSPQKPLLQVSYGSSSSLPASYKVRELQPPPPETPHRKRSTQSDSALLPSNIYFQRTLSPVSVPSKAVSRRGRRRGTKEEEMSKTLDQAIEVARSMKRTTDRMAKRLSADLAKSQLDRRLHSTQPLGGRKHHVL
uniref:AKNA domain-containing protein n=1 Tax=Scophthalmus maximus TaxID=52904 RepID=A0A8D3CZJ9_SCOMX